jgi:hypothetical protein
MRRSCYRVPVSLKTTAPPECDTLDGHGCDQTPMSQRFHRYVIDPTCENLPSVYRETFDQSREFMGFDPNLAILFSGIGTVIFFVVVGGRVPSAGA